MADYESRSFVYYGPGDVRTETRPVTCGQNDIVIRVEVCGRCGTDRRLFNVSHPLVSVPTVLGHELVGTIVEIGTGVTKLTEGVGHRGGQDLTPYVNAFTTGQRVTVQSRIARHNDERLMLMEAPIENLSFRIPGAFAQYMRISEEMIRGGAALIVPDHVPDEAAALSEPVACALESIFATPHPVGVEPDGRHRYRAGILPGGRTLIIGSGTLAMVYGRLAEIEGAAEVWFIVRSQAKVELIRAVLGEGPSFRIVPDYAERPLPEKLEVEAELEEELRDLTGGALFDDIVLACPSTDAQRYMFRLLNPNGYGVAACFAGVREPSDAPGIDLLHYRIGKAIGTSGCSTRAMETVLDWLSTGRLSLEGMTCPHPYTLDDPPEEFFCTRADGRKPMLFPWQAG